MKSLPFYKPEAWKRYPFWAEPPRIGHYREYPPPPPHRGLDAQQTSKLFTEFPQEVSSKRTESNWCLPSELKSDCKTYFGFVVDKFSEVVNTEIATFSIIAWSDCRYKLRIPLLQIHNNLNNRFAVFTSNTPNTFWLDFLWAFSEQPWLPGI